MKPLRSILSILLFSVCVAASAQSDAQHSFDQLKTLAGTWDGTVAMPANPSKPAMPPIHVHVVLRATSTGNAVLHEMTMDGRPDDPITMFYVDGDRLVATHYCDVGNRPHFTARVSPDGKTFDFDFLNVSGPLTHGHMQHIVFHFIDANHHTEKWTFEEAGGMQMGGLLELARTQ